MGATQKERKGIKRTFGPTILDTMKVLYLSSKRVNGWQGDDFRL